MIYYLWTTFTSPSHADLELQGLLMENQTDSRERFIKETAKRAGITSNYYRDWTYSHQTRGDTLSAITIVTVTQPWQRSKLLDFVKKSDGLKEKFYIKDEEETKWDKIANAFGNGQQNARNTIKIQPQISLWDRITGIPLKVAMSIAQEQQIPFNRTGEITLWYTRTPGNTSCGRTSRRRREKLRCTSPQRIFPARMHSRSSISPNLVSTCIMNWRGKGNGKGKSMA